MTASTSRLIHRTSLAVASVALAAASLSPLPARAEKREPVADERLALPAPASFSAAVSAIERVTGAKGDRLDLGAGRPQVPLTEGRSFALEARTASRLLAGSHKTYRKAGFYLFRYDRGFGLPGEKDLVGLLATSDADVVIRKIGTAGPKRGVTTENVIAWLHALGKEEPFDVIEMGADFIMGRFDRVPKDPEGIARRAAQFAPDLTKGHSDPISGLTDLVGRKKTLYLIWD